jgi:hypothetical protein
MFSQSIYPPSFGGIPASFARAQVISPQKGFPFENLFSFFTLFPGEFHYTSYRWIMFLIQTLVRVGIHNLMFKEYIF